MLDNAEYKLLDVRHVSFPRSKKWLILANPASGAGKAVSIFKERIHPMMAEAEIEHELIVTGKYNCTMRKGFCLEAV